MKNIHLSTLLTCAATIFTLAPTALQAKPHLPSILVIDTLSGKAVTSQNINESRPIASLTKIALALVVEPIIEQYQCNMPASFIDLDYYKNTSTVVSLGKVYTCQELLELTMVRSDNVAANLLARNLFNNSQNAIEEMNQMARSLGLKNTVFVDTSGIREGNISTAHEISKITQVATTKSLLLRVSSQNKVDLIESETSILNTNPLMRKGILQPIFSKTGFTNAAGKNIAVVAQHFQTDKRLMVIIMGASRGPQREQIVLRYLGAPLKEIAALDPKVKKKKYKNDQRSTRLSRRSKK